MILGRIFVILLTISSTMARCPFGNSVNIYGRSGVITAQAGYTRRDKCEWKIFAPRQKRNHKITVNISRITCTKNLVIEGEDFCQHKPRITRTYIPNSCKEDCKRSSCRKIKGYPLIITYGKYADDHGFVIRFAYEPCGASTRPTVSTSVGGQQKTTSRRPTKTRLTTAKTTQSTLNDATTDGLNVTFSPKSLFKNSTVSESTTKGTTLSQVSATSEIPMAAIIAPIAVVLFIVALLIIIGVKLRKTEQENEKEQAKAAETMQSYIPTSNVTGAALYETINKNDAAQTYTNETYQPLPMDGTGGKYAENKYDTVFQPTAASETTANESQASGTHIYEHVEAAAATDITKIDHQYDEVASETDSFDDCSSDEDENHAGR